MSKSSNDLTYYFTVAAGIRGQKFFSPANDATIEYCGEHYPNQAITELHPDFDSCGKYVIVHRGDDVLDMGEIEWYGTHGAGIYFRDMTYIYNRDNRRAELQDYMAASYLEAGDRLEITPQKPENYREFTFAKFTNPDRDHPAPKIRQHHQALEQK